MEFAWSADDAQRSERALAFARDRVSPALRERGAGHLRREHLQLAAESGLLGLSVPAEHGGSGLGALATAHVVEGFARGCDDAGLVFSACAHLFACAMPIAEHGSEEQKQALLPGLCSGELVGANAITEPEAGSDAFSLATKAVADDRGGWRLSGTKSYVTNAPIADRFLVYATTNPAHGYLGITAFVLDRDTPGLEVGEHFDKVGLASTPVAAITLDDCRVGADRVLGAAGAGAGIFIGSMGWERACLFAQYLGAMERQLEEVVAHAKQRRQFGKPLGRHQAVAHRIADMKLRLEAARLLLYRACWLKDQGADAPDDAELAIALSKIAVSEAAVQSGLDAIHLLGGEGVKTAVRLAGDVGDAIPSRIFSGTSEMQRDTIARRLGL